VPVGLLLFHRHAASLHRPGRAIAGRRRSLAPCQSTRSPERAVNTDIE